jgi:hypothetical protein
VAAQQTLTFGIEAKDKTGRAFKSLDQSLKSTARTLNVIQGPLGPLAGRFNALASAFGSINPAVLAFSAGITASIFAIKKGISVYADTEQQLLQLEAQLKATGFAAGKSAQELEDIAQALARSTLSSLDEVRAAEGILVSFRTVAEDTFNEVLKQAQNLAASGMGSLTDSTKQLGKALEDPVGQLGALGRAGVRFTNSQKATIKEMVETNRLAEAQTLILAELEKTVGGSGVAGGSGLAGAFDSLSQSTTNFWAALGKTATGDFFTEVVAGATEAIQDLADAMTEVSDLSLDRLSQQYQEQLKEVDSRRAILDRIKAQPDGAKRKDFKIKLAQSNLDESVKELQILEDELKVRQKTNAVVDDKRKITQEQLALDRQIGIETKNQAAARKAAENEAKAWMKQQQKDLKARLTLLQKAVDTADPMGALLQEQAALMAAIKDEGEEYAHLIAPLAAHFQDQIDALNGVKDEVKEISQAATQIGDAFGSAFMSATFEAEKLSDVFSSLLQDIAKIIIQQTIVNSLAGAVSGGVASAFPGFGAGAAIGGNRSGPTLVGERGPEILNLPAGSKITPNNKMGGNVQINVVNNGTDTQVEEQRQPDGSMLINLINSTVSESISRGGPVSRAIRTSFGSRQKAVTR